MHKISVVAFLLVTATILPLVSYADKIELNDGSIIHGTVIEANDDFIKIVTDLFGTLEISRSNIKDVECAEISESISDCNEIYSERPETEPEKHSLIGKRNLEFSFSLGIDGEEGNSNKFELDSKFSIMMKREKDWIEFWFDIERDRLEGETTKYKTEMGIDYEREITRRWLWYTKIKDYISTTKKIDHRYTVGGGVGYYFIKRKNHQLQSRIGPIYLHEKYDSPEEGEEQKEGRTVFGYDLEVRYLYILTKWLHLYDSCLLEMRLDDTNEFLIDHEFGLEIPIGKADLFKLQVGLENDFFNKPPEGQKRMDTDYFIRLKVTWNRGDVLRLIKPKVGRF